MRKILCSISVFLFLCILSAGYYSTYRVSDNSRRNTGQLSQTDLTREARQEEGQQQEEAQPEEASAALEGQAVLAQGGQESFGLYYLKDADGYVAVYLADRTTLYEPTNISIGILPEAVRLEICSGKYIKSQEELYSFLENYSS